MTIWQPTLSNSSSPLYKQLADAIDKAIADGELRPGAKLPPQRRLAYALGVTVGTVTRGYNEAERRGSVEARVGSGTFVKERQQPNYFGQTGADPHFDLQSANPPEVGQLAMLSNALAALASDPETLAHCLRYQPETGTPQQLQQLAEWLKARSIEADNESLLFTYGGQQGTALTLQALCLAGDTVLCEGLAFPGISAACQQMQLRCIGLAMDEEGITVEALKSAIAQSNPRVLYLTAQIQNPTCVMMSAARRKQISLLCRSAGVLILEDDVQFLPVSDKAPSFYGLDPDNTVYVSSFSKCFSGGLRIGYLAASPGLREKIRASLRAACWTISPLLLEILCRWLADGTMSKLEQDIKNEMAGRAEILTRLLQGYEIRFHPHGFNAWLALPEPWRAVDFVQYARERGVLLRAAETYAVGRFAAPQSVRISLCAPHDRQALTSALEIIRECLETGAPVGDPVF